jgi:hypothetical protein
MIFVMKSGLTAMTKPLSLLLFLSTLLFSACAPFVPVEQIRPVVNISRQATAIPTPTAQIIPVTCIDIEANWGKDWPILLNVLEQLIEADQSCGPEPLLSKKYAAHYIYGVALEEQGQPEQAITQFQAALSIDPRRQEALNALFRLDALPEPTPPNCLSLSDPLPDPAPAEAPDPDQFVTVQGDQLQLAGQPFKVKGLNYYPRHAPWARFFDEAEPAKMAQELDLIQQAGFNTIRVFLWYKPLFTCRPEDAIPNETTFALVDTLVQLARERNLKLIMTLNDLPDLMFRPLYTDFAHYDAQTVYLVRRYRNEPAILAWDMRNASDADYTGDEAPFSQAEVLQWLEHVTGLIREHDPYHLLTASWDGDPTVTEPYIDIVSFQHWAEADTLQARLQDYKAKNTKPLLLEAAGFHSWAEAPDDPQDEQKQAEKLVQVTHLVEAEDTAGWVLWTAFDFVPSPGWPPTSDHFFGLWRVDLTPKPALEQLPLN